MDEHALNKELSKGSKAKTILGWSAETDIKSGLKKTIDWYEFKPNIVY